MWKASLVRYIAKLPNVVKQFRNSYMKDTLEYKILKYLHENDNVKTIEVSHLHIDKEYLKKSLSNLRREKYIKCRLINNENIIAEIELKGKEYLSKIDSNKNITNNFNNSTIGQFNQESSFSESPISIKTNEIPSKKPETKSRLNKLLSNPWLVGMSVAVFTAVLNGKRVMKYINNILDNI